MSDYKDIDGNTTMLYKLVRSEPDWASSRIESMGKQIEQLKRELKKKEAVILHMLKMDESHNLKQRAKGIEDAVEYVGGSEGDYLDFAKQLRKQAEEL